MKPLTILQYPDPRLQRVAASVPIVDDQIRALAARMAHSMYAAGGIGLAATQVDVHLRVIVVDVSARRDQLHTLINPRILKAGGTAQFEEGCLSVPGVYAEVRRAAWIQLRALDALGKAVDLYADGELAMCIQHEMDHLQGIVFVEHLAPARQERILTNARDKSRQKPR